MHPVFPFSVSSLIKLHVCSFSVELDILGFLLPDHDGILQVDMDDDNQLMSTWLEKKMLDVGKEDINIVTTMIPIA